MDKKITIQNFQARQREIKATLEVRANGKTICLLHPNRKKIKIANLLISRGGMTDMTDMTGKTIIYFFVSNLKLYRP